jgi:hypothetical protein
MQLHRMQTHRVQDRVVQAPLRATPSSRIVARSRHPAPALLLAWAVLGSSAVAAEPATFVVPSVFHIEKSENRNQVHYAVKVDDRCRPQGKQPVYGYWRDLELGPRATSPLLDHEQSAYGLTEPRWIRLRDAGGEIRIGLRGFPDRTLTLETSRVEGRCTARARTQIGGRDAVLLSIYVKLGFLFSIDYVLVRGVRIEDGKPVQEKVDD